LYAIFSLDPAQYLTTPGLSWEAMLKTTNIQLELLTDIDIYRFIQGCIRGGLVQCCHRYTKANNKYLSDYDSSKESSFLMYVDANNLYGWAMSQPLPYKISGCLPQTYTILILIIFQSIANTDFFWKWT